MFCTRENEEWFCQSFLISVGERKEILSFFFFFWVFNSFQLTSPNLKAEGKLILFLKKAQEIGEVCMISHSLFLILCFILLCCFIFCEGNRWIQIMELCSSCFTPWKWYLLTAWGDRRLQYSPIKLLPCGVLSVLGKLASGLTRSRLWQVKLPASTNQVKGPG